MKGQGHTICVQMCSCCNGGGVHFDIVASRLTGSYQLSFVYFIDVWPTTV